MHYLSVVNTPEFNLQLAAEYNIRCTQELLNRSKEADHLKIKLNLSLATAVTTVALGIIFIASMKIVAGITVTVMAIVPLCMWLIFKKQSVSNQIEIDKEVEELKSVYQGMIDFVKIGKSTVNLRKYALLIANSPFPTTLIKEKWEELKKACYEYSMPPNSTLRIENGFIIYQDDVCSATIPYGSK